MSVKVYTLSDLHVDYQENLDYLLSLDAKDYHDSTFIVSGDATDNLPVLRRLLKHFSQTFANVFFVPGNHELWIRKNSHKHSLAKFDDILSICSELGVHTTPKKVGQGDGAVWIVPLFSWYTKADGGNDTLFRSKPGDDQTEALWVDNRCCDWSSLPPNTRVVDYFLNLNQPHIEREYDAPVISFSHFLPLQELIFPLGYPGNLPKNWVDPMPQFNFTRVAGTTLLDEQIHKLGSTIHVYGHQHRNRHRTINGVTYISHCLGYPRERQRSTWHGEAGPKLIWHDAPVDISTQY